MKRSRLSPLSDKRRRERAEYLAVYRIVDERTTYAPLGRCECRCGQRATDHHHTKKPRRKYHHPDFVVRLARSCHDRAEGRYDRGRLIVTPLGDQRFTFELVTAADKWAARAAR